LASIWLSNIVIIIVKTTCVNNFRHDEIACSKMIAIHIEFGPCAYFVVFLKVLAAVV